MRSSWTEMPLGEVISLEYGKPLPVADRHPSGRYPVYGANGVKDRTDRYYVDTPSIIVGRKGSAGEVTLTDDHFWPLDVTYFVTYDSDRHERMFLYYLLKSCDLPRLAKGVKPGINRNDVYSLRVKIPPRDEQKRVAQIIEASLSDAEMSSRAARTAATAATSVFDSFLASKFAVPGADWTTRPLGKVCRLINGRAYKKHEMLKAGKYPLLRVGNFFTNKEWYFSDLELDPDKYCDEGDLLYAWSASFGPRIWDGGKVIFHYHIWKIIPDTEVVSKLFLFYLLRWDVDQIKGAHGTGTTMMHVSKGSMEQRILPIPPLEQQRQITDALDAVERETQVLNAIYLRKEEAVRSLKDAVLHEAMNDQLRVAS